MCHIEQNHTDPLKKCFGAIQRIEKFVFLHENTLFLCDSDLTGVAALVHSAGFETLI